MRKGISEGRSNAVRLNHKVLKKLENQGYKFVLVKGLTPDHHYEHVEPHFLLLVPVKELPSDPGQKDIYAPIHSKILEQWATEEQEDFQILIAAGASSLKN